jgi:hypothetical protein
LARKQPDRQEGLMTASKIVLAGALASLCLATAVQAADYQEEPYAEVETRYQTQVIEVPQARPFPPHFREERTHLGPRYVEERIYGRPVPDWRYRSRPVAARPWRGPGEDCRVIIKQRENPWGEVTVRRIEVCD